MTKFLKFRLDILLAQCGTKSEGVVTLCYTCIFLEQSLKIFKAFKSFKFNCLRSVSDILNDNTFTCMDLVLLVHVHTCI